MFMGVHSPLFLFRGDKFHWAESVSRGCLGGDVLASIRASSSVDWASIMPAEVSLVCAYIHISM